MDQAEGSIWDVERRDGCRVVARVLAHVSRTWMP